MNESKNYSMYDRKFQVEVKRSMTKYWPKVATHRPTDFSEKEWMELYGILFHEFQDPCSSSSSISILLEQILAYFIVLTKQNFCKREWRNVLW